MDKNMNDNGLNMGPLGASYNDGTPTWVAGHKERHAIDSIPLFQWNQPHVCLCIYIFTYIIVFPGAAGTYTISG